MLPTNTQQPDSEAWRTSSQLELGLAEPRENVDTTTRSQDPSPNQSGPQSENHSQENSATTSAEQSGANSANQSRRASGETRPQRERHRVRFGLEAEGQNAPRSQSQSRSNSASRNHSRNSSGGNSGVASGSSSPRSPFRPNAPRPLPTPRTGTSPFLDKSTDITESPSRSPLTRSSRGLYSSSVADDVTEEDEDNSSDHDEAIDGTIDVAAFQADRARSRAERLSRSLHPKPRMSKSAPGSKLPSPEASAPPSPDLTSQTTQLPKDLTDLIPLEELHHRRKKYGIEDETDSEDEHDQLQPKKQGTRSRMTKYARNVLRTITGGLDGLQHVQPSDPAFKSGQNTPDYDRGDPEHYIARPQTYKSSVLGTLLGVGLSDQGTTSLAASQFASSQPPSRPSSAYGYIQSGGATPMTTPGGSPTTSPPSSGYVTPKRKIPKWHEKTESFGNHSTTSLSTLITSSNILAAPGATTSSISRPQLKQRPHSSGMETIKSLAKKAKKDKVKDSESKIRIKIHIEDILARQRYIIDCCRALMQYGAPTHRLEEYMKYLARVLEIKGQFLYIPGCMLISFDDPATHTTEMKIVRVTQGVNLGKLLDMHDIYKAVTHDKMGVRDASELLDELTKKKQRYHPWVCVVLYGCASASVGPFAFGARPIDMPISFLLGCILGFMQLILAPKSELYSNVFEIFAAVVTSFLARMFGSLRGGDLFCFSALAQSSIALILPGYMVLCSALELQSKNMVAGSVRMVYAIIYSLFLGFGITIGTAFYGGIDSNATSDTTCRTQPIQGKQKFIFVPFFTLCLILINQAKWRQAPAMLIISFAGYIVNFFSAERFASNAQVANTLGALVIGCLGNLYSRFFQGMSAAALMPAIFVQVPSGLAATGSLISGITSADQIVSNTTTASTSPTESLSDQGIVFNVGYSMIQIAVGLTVGLFFSSLIIYPFGKKRSGLFSF